MKIKVNEIIPDINVFQLIDGEPVKSKITDIIKEKKIVIFGLPGAFTSTCSKIHLPGYVNSFEKFQSKGIDKILCISVNDPFVMGAWGKSNNANDKISMIADPFIEFTKAIGADVDISVRGLGIRSKRYAMLINNLKIVEIQEEIGTGCELSSAENILDLI
tara:strand:+ start:731 stop:1213 length:483 start_codon:yes stop_codon:yes gene_type:complete